MQNEGQQLRTTSSTKNEFISRETHQGTKNNTIHKDQITNQRPKTNPIKTINEQKRKNEQNTRTTTKNYKQRARSRKKKKAQAQHNKTKVQKTTTTLIQNKEQKLRTTSRTKNGFMH
jgi:hypothetical protein